ncbi:NADH-quinone oxidoreductase subunit NuoF [Pajaroellobacter abortibovis]|uniref:NADH dehydrogenase n=1 Tax=Pajaroellobacter abortibovis TaxID=1882918 RepID=A0A1L6MXC7_9BACT|nr:NADH-quinone oxidoreductase subunit NuoF [Pajaroellobacter abortibovis]APS00204.1 NADH dehydrogenase [Pajaroellobacter abortibovis]
MIRKTDYLTRNYGKPNGWTLDAYMQAGGYEAIKKAFAMTHQEVIEEAKKANIRGRGGAGFPVGIKWSFMKPHPTKPSYLVINADEGEPGTHKDRTIMEQNPHAILEGCMIGCYAIGAHTTYIYVRDELHLSKARLNQAIQEAYARGYLGSNPSFAPNYPIHIHVHTGAGAYICGEETSLLNSLEGRRGEPRLKPPFPAQTGAFGCPTTVNNVETIATIPTAILLGGDAFSQLSALHSFKDGGVRLFGVNGHVKNPTVVELCIGVTIRELIEEIGGGVLQDRSILGVIPGGSSTPILLPSETIYAPDEKDPMHPWHGKSVLDVPMGVDTMRAAKTMLGTCCITVLAEGTCPVLAMQNLMQFYHHESCGQCTPCREGSAWLDRTLIKILNGKGTLDDLNQLSDIASQIMGNTICAFGEGTAMPALAFLQKFRPYFEDYIRSTRTKKDAKLTVS